MHTHDGLSVLACARWTPRPRPHHPWPLTGFRMMMSRRCCSWCCDGTARLRTACTRARASVTELHLRCQTRCVTGGEPAWSSCRALYNAQQQAGSLPQHARLAELSSSLPAASAAQWTVPHAKGVCCLQLCSNCIPFADLHLRQKFTSANHVI